jgi:hypothetical protein
MLVQNVPRKERFLVVRPVYHVQHLCCGDFERMASLETFFLLDEYKRCTDSFD